MFLTWHAGRKSLSSASLSTAWKQVNFVSLEWGTSYPGMNAIAERANHPIRNRGNGKAWTTTSVNRRMGRKDLGGGQGSGGFVRKRAVGGDREEG